jgi:hypothetical protein
MLSSKKVLDEIKFHIDNIRKFRLFAAHESSDRTSYHCAFKTLQQKSLTPLLANIGLLKLDAAHILRNESLWWTMGHVMKRLDNVDVSVLPLDLEFLLCRILSPNTYFMDEDTEVKIHIPDDLEKTNIPLVGRIRSDVGLQERIVIPPIEALGLQLGFSYDVNAFISLFASVGVRMVKMQRFSTPPGTLIKVLR